MPRTADPANKAQQERQRRYRQRLADGRVPECDAVDRAVAAATTAVSASLVREGGMTPEKREVIGGIAEAAVRFLVAGGYAQHAARRIALRRMSRWQSAKTQGDLIRRASLDSKIPLDGGRGS